MSLISKFNSLNANQKNALYAGTETVANTVNGLLGGSSGAVAKASKAFADTMKVIPGLEMFAGPTELFGSIFDGLFSSKVNEENVNSVKSNIAAANTYNYASNFDTLAENNMPAKLNFSKSFLGKDGLFSNKVSNMYKDLKAQAADAETFASNAFANNLNTLKTQQSQDASAVFTAAYGGPLNMKNKGVLSPFGNRFAWGGLPRSPLYNYGSNWTNGLSFINAGGTHESNPFEGIQVGIDPQGTPNLVEEGEVIWNDYVFSNRLRVPKAVRNKYKLGGIKPLTFADAVKRLQKESEERPNDPISQLGLNDYMTKMAIAQEMKRAQLNKKGTNNMAAYGGKVNKFSGEEDYANLSPEQLAVTQNEYNWWKGLTDYQRILAANYYFPGSSGSRDWAMDALYHPNVPDGKHILSYASKVKNSDNDMGPANTIKAAYAARDLLGNVTLPKDASITTMPSILFKKGDYASGFPTPTLTSAQKESISKGIDIKRLQNEMFPSNARGNTGDNTRENTIAKWARLVPALGGAIGLATTAIKGRDYSGPDKLENFAKDNLREYKWEPTGDFLAYKPVDRMSLVAPAQALANASRRSITNTVGGNRGTAIASILGSDYNNALNLGKQYLAADDTNWGRYKDSKEYNRASRQFDAEGALKAFTASQDNNRLRYAALKDSVDGRRAIDDAYTNSIALNLGNLLTSIGNWGIDTLNRNDVRWLARRGVLGQLGNDYSPSSGALLETALGGLLNRRKKK